MRRLSWRAASRPSTSAPATVSEIAEAPSHIPPRRLARAPSRSRVRNVPPQRLRVARRRPPHPRVRPAHQCRAGRWSASRASCSRLQHAAVNAIPLASTAADEVLEFRPALVRGHRLAAKMRGFPARVRHGRHRGIAGGGVPRRAVHDDSAGRELREALAARGRRHAQPRLRGDRGRGRGATAKPQRVRRIALRARPGVRLRRDADPSQRYMRMLVDGAKEPVVASPYDRERSRRCPTRAKRRLRMLFVSTSSSPPCSSGRDLRWAGDRAPSRRMLMEAPATLPTRMDEPEALRGQLRLSCCCAPPRSSSRCSGGWGDGESDSADAPPLWRAPRTSTDGLCEPRIRPAYLRRRSSASLSRQARDAKEYRSHCAWPPRPPPRSTMREARLDAQVHRTSRRGARPPC